jgi:hypothetical protein
MVSDKPKKVLMVVANPASQQQYSGKQVARVVIQMLGL